MQERFGRKKRYVFVINKEVSISNQQDSCLVHYVLGTMLLYPEKETNTHGLTKTGSEIILTNENSESLAKAGEYHQLEENMFCSAFLHIKDENHTFTFISVSKETVKSVPSQISWD